MATPEVQQAPSPFREWLASRMERDGRSMAAVGIAAGVNPETVRGILMGKVARPSERTARALATALGDEPDQIAIMAGRGALHVSPPNPLAFASFPEWLRATLDARKEHPVRASMNAGLQAGHISTILRSGYTPERPILDKIAAYFGADQAAVRAFRTRSEARVSAGKAIAERRGADAMQAMAAQGRASITLTPERRQAIARLGGAATSRRLSPEEQQARGQHAVATRKARGFWFNSEETKAQHAANVSASGGPKRGGASTLARHGVEHFRRAGKIAGAKKRNGEDVLCLVCKDTQRLIYRTPSQQVRGRGLYHRECYEAWRQTDEQREKSGALGTIGWIWSRVKHAGDEPLARRVREQMDAEIKFLRNPRGRGRRSTLLRRKDKSTGQCIPTVEAAIWAAIMHVEYGMTAREIGEIVGFTKSKKPSKHGEYDYEVPSASTWELIRFGRVLLGL